MKPTFTHLLFCLLAFAFCLQKIEAAPPVWTVNVPSFSKSMTATMRIKLDGVFINATTTIAAAHVGGVLRSNGTPALLLGPNAYFFPTIYSNQPSGETVGFWVYVASTDHVHPATQTFPFVHQSSQGSAGSPFILDISSAVVLPIELAEFSAKTIENGQKTQLDWRTESETNNLGFEVERSADGLDFEKIGEVEGQNRAAAYRFLDENPLGGRSFYRLRQLNLDGKANFSPVRTVDLSARKQLEIKSAAGGFWLFSDSEADVRLRVFDPTNRLLFEKTASETIFISLDNWPTGAFFVAAERGDGMKTSAVLMKH